MGLTSSLHSRYDITHKKIDSGQDLDTTYFHDIVIDY
jgi:hypothetical protein